MPYETLSQYWTGIVRSLWPTNAVSQTHSPFWQKPSDKLGDEWILNALPPYSVEQSASVLSN
jgi:hypothetical protein